ncbi:MAG TPA: polysaccharide biosynthesis/export family protein [Candidatus Binatia bacterium]|nr:polysaccharide biosynthesis/export family protein [Candidatus Binatia bacterium]
MKTNLLGCAIVASSLVLGCATKDLRIQEFRVAPNTPDPGKPPEEFYQIGAGDTLNINVWKEPTLSGTVRVRPDGYITLPLINEVQVVGLSTAQLRKLLEDKYKEFTTDPFVTIRVEGIASSEVFLVGQVSKPGAFPLVGNETVLQLLTRAGGLGIFADRSNIRVVRRDGSKVTEYIVDYDAIVKGDLKQDVLLRPGDRIIVP